MAVDTAARRFSALNPAIPWRSSSVIPDGAINAADRRALARLYSGLASGNAYSLEATFGSFAMTGNPAELTPTTNIDTALERFAAMNVGSPWRGINVLPSGSIGRTQRQIIGGYYVPYATGPTYSLTAETGSFAWDGEPSFSDFEIAAQTASYQMTGSDALLLATRTAFLNSGVFSMTGNDANLNHFTERTLVAVSGVFGWTGSDAVFDRPRSMQALRGSFEMLGAAANLVWYDETGTPRPDPLEPGANGAAPFRRWRYNREEKIEEAVKPKAVIQPKPAPVERKKPALVDALPALPEPKPVQEENDDAEAMMAAAALLQ